MQNNSFIIAAIIFLFLSNKLTIFLLNKSIISSFSLTKNTRIRLRVRLNDKIENGMLMSKTCATLVFLTVSVLRNIKSSFPQPYVLIICYLFIKGISEELKFKNCFQDDYIHTYTHIFFNEEIENVFFVMSLTLRSRSTSLSSAPPYLPLFVSPHLHHPLLSPNIRISLAKKIPWHAMVNKTHQHWCEEFRAGQLVGTFVMPQTGTTYSGPLRDSLEISWCHGAEEAALGGVEQVNLSMREGGLKTKFTV